MHSDTPSAEADGAEHETVEVVDPRHPLWGRRFRLVSVTGAWASTGYARVELRPGVPMMLPLPVTSLWQATRRSVLATKLTAGALTELIAIAGESEGACPSSLVTSGRACRRPSAGSSPRTSAAFCGK